ncbi:gp58-like family protein [Enterococcus wangshanyuanii]|uniref:Gp58-like domain-containing protein n=1 Tax=Enterococcus wangshanyuanii TaxID=2005703 RepID=A0ABQ1P2H3_9ENTE|nr:gp58-like family protein [Enterococcus wangshanyuanii]GGC87779.1 hypothetical protein GCM10011573_16740 [Enterococcus wangshanyuanii]
MLKVSDDFLTAIAGTRRTMSIQIKINDIIYTNDDITKFSLDSGSMGGSSFGIGSTFANTIKIEFCKIIEGLKETDPIEVYMGIKVRENGPIQPLKYPFRMGSAKIGFAQLTTYHADETEFVSLGRFFIKGRVDPDRNENKTTVEAMDAWMFMGGLYESQLKYPAPLRNVALEIANLSGMEVNLPSFNALSPVLIDKPEGYTYRQALGLLGQIEGKYARFDREGLLEFTALQDPNYFISTNEYYLKGLVKNEVLFRIGGISCKVVKRDAGGTEVSEVLQAGSDKGAQIALESNIMTQALLNSLYNKIKDVNFYPYTLKWRGNPALEAGDWITMIDRKGNKFKVPNLNYRLEYSGGLSATSLADTTPASDVVYSYKGPITQTLDNMNQRIDAAGKNTVYEGIDEPPYPKEGDIWFKPNGPDKEIWIYRQLDDGSFGWVKEVSTAPNDQLLAEIEESSKNAQEAKEAANDAVSKADQAIKDAGFANENVDFANEEISSLKITIKGLQVTVANKAEQSQVTQLAGQITSVVADVEGNKSQITQLSNDINLKVSTGDVINQINISPESILISGKKIQITGDTYIENGIITNAKIKDLNADKINAGTINAANVNIINMNASSISTGTISGSDMAINLNSGEVFFSRGYMVSLDDKFRLDITEKYLEMSGKNVFGVDVTTKLDTLGLVSTIASTGATSKFSFDRWEFEGQNTKIRTEMTVLGFRVTATDAQGYIGRLQAGTGNIYYDVGRNSTLQIGGGATNSTVRVTATNFTVTGTKNAAHVTRDGVRLTPAYETAESYLGDIGESRTDSNCECIIEIETLFGDTVNTDIPYQIFLSSYSKSNVWVESRTSSAFVVKSELPNASFTWEIKAKRRGYEIDRLVLDKTFDNEKIDETYKEELI